MHFIFFCFWSWIKNIRLFVFLCLPVRCSSSMQNKKNSHNTQGLNCSIKISVLSFPQLLKWKKTKCLYFVDHTLYKEDMNLFLVCNLWSDVRQLCKPTKNNRFASDHKKCTFFLKFLNWRKQSVSILRTWYKPGRLRLFFCIDAECLITNHKTKKVHLLYMTPD